MGLFLGYSPPFVSDSAPYGTNQCATRTPPAPAKQLKGKKVFAICGVAANVPLALRESVGLLMPSTESEKGQQIRRLLPSLQTGIILLILVGVAAAAGTVVLQRPMTDPEKLQQAYSPETLRWLDATGLTDVFHSWWFATLLALLSINIVLASLERLPNAWRQFARPNRHPAAQLLKGLSVRKEIPVRDTAVGFAAAEEAFRAIGLKPQRLAGDGGTSLFAERNRFSRLAPYVVHASLLLIFAGGIADALWGYRGFLALTEGQQSNQIELREGVHRTLPFTVRCDNAGREDYADGSPRRWWSQLAVLEDGRELKRKTIEVNEPLSYRGLRFYQSGYGSTGELGAVQLQATSRRDPGRVLQLRLRLGETQALDPGTSVRLAAFFPDFVIQGKEIASRSDQPNNPAIQLVVESKTPLADQAMQPETVWIFPRFPNFSHPDSAPYAFAFRDLKMGYFTALQVSHEPGQWAVWAGVILMGIGLALSFYFVHLRYWVVLVGDDRGRAALWVGASANKNRDEIEERFQKLIREIERNLCGAPERKTQRAPASLVAPAVRT